MIWQVRKCLTLICVGEGVGRSRKESQMDISKSDLMYLSNKWDYNYYLKLNFIFLKIAHKPMYQLSLLLLYTQLLMCWELFILKIVKSSSYFNYTDTEISGRVFLSSIVHSGHFKGWSLRKRGNLYWGMLVILQGSDRSQLDQDQGK